MILGQPCAFVDLETTGASAQSERITEVGLRLFHPDGDSLDFQQLLNPGKSIPAFISQLTGINSAMVA
ncbi:MAG: DNA polymerase III subunit epsilon, partial [Pseudomonadales bacterium]|nr:DNA polymerase III subunit epsilon [Pseudomonadales bacterium]